MDTNHGIGLLPVVIEIGIGGGGDICIKYVPLSLKMEEKKTVTCISYYTSWFNSM